MDEIGLEGSYRKEFFQRLVLTAHHMVNTPDKPEEKEDSCDL
jgi:hemoglobin